MGKIDKGKGWFACIAVVVHAEYVNQIATWIGGLIG